MPTTATTERAPFARMADLKTAMWTAVREQRIADSMALSAELEAVCEDFRREHFPRAREVFAVCDRVIGQRLSVYRRTPSGRGVLVYEEREV